MRIIIYGLFYKMLNWIVRTIHKKEYINEKEKLKILLKEAIRKSNYYFYNSNIGYPFLYAGMRARIRRGN